MIVQIEYDDGYEMGGNSFIVETTLSNIFDLNPWLTYRAQSHIEQSLLIGERVQLGDGFYLVRPHYHERGH